WILVVLRAGQLRYQRARPPGICRERPPTDPDVVDPARRRREVALQPFERQRRILYFVAVAPQSGHRLRRPEPQPRVAARTSARIARAAARTTGTACSARGPRPGRPARTARGAAEAARVSRDRQQPL